MNCPKDAGTMSSVPYRDSEVFSCDVCDGVWIPQKLIGSLTGWESLTNHDSTGAVPVRIPIRCPVDGQELTVLSRVRVLIDQCPKCHGLWLDKNELQKLKASLRSPSQKDSSFAEAAVGVIGILFGVAEFLVED